MIQVATIGVPVLDSTTRANRRKAESEVIRASNHPRYPSRSFHRPDLTINLEKGFQVIYETRDYNRSLNLSTLIGVIPQGITPQFSYISSSRYAPLHEA